MFPSVKTRVATAARRSLDLAIEFATLGEYRLPDEPGAGPATPGLTGPAVLDAGSAMLPGPSRARPRRLRPASVAARRLQPVERGERIAPRTGVRALALSAHPRGPIRTGRQRAGAARPRPQPCLVADAIAAPPMDG